MFTETDTKQINKLKLIIATILLFIFHGSFSQTNKINVSPFTLDIGGGLNVPVSDFKDYANNGYQMGLMLNKGVYKNLSLGVSANYNHFGIKDNFESPDNAWSSISLGVGPQYTLPINIFFIQLYGHIGMSLIKTPEITQYAQNVHESFDKKDLDIFKLASENTTGFHTDFGVKLGAQLSKKIRLFVGSTYSTSLNSPIKYNSRDISEAIHPSGEVNMDLVNRIPFEEKGISFSSFNVNAGISINLGNTSTAIPAQDYNSSRSNKPSPIKWVDDKIGNDTVPRLVKDYNASRKDYDAKKPKEPRSITPPNSGGENDSVPKPLYAQDYNSSRSNKPSPIKWNDVEIGNDSVPWSVQDYNSSRSNKPRPIIDVVSENDSVAKPAQDYNSSRSNKPSPIKWNEIETDNDSVPRSVQDYNSSRSNKPRPIIDVVSENDSVAKPAQDYNSSRSNKPSPIIDIEENDTVQLPIRVVDKIKDINKKEKKVVLVGLIKNITLDSRSFELIDENKQKIIGQFQDNTTDKEIIDLKRKFENKKAMIYVNVRRKVLDIDKEVFSFQLLKMQQHNKEGKFNF